MKEAYRYIGTGSGEHTVLVITRRHILSLAVIFGIEPAFQASLYRGLLCEGAPPFMNMTTCEPVDDIQQLKLVNFVHRKIRGSTSR